MLSRVDGQGDDRHGRQGRVDPSALRQAYNDHQPGNPARAGKAILQVLQADNPPTHLLLGTDALRAVAASRATRNHEIETWRALSESTDDDQATS